MNEYLKNKTGEAHDMQELATSLEFARLGDGEFAYIRTVDVQEAYKMFPSLSGVPEDMQLFSLHSADGTPIALTDSLDAAVADARENDLKPMHVN